MKFQSEPNTSAGEFFELLENSGYRWPAKLEGTAKQNGFTVPQGTTVLAFHFHQQAQILQFYLEVLHYSLRVLQAMPELKYLPK